MGRFEHEPQSPAAQQRRKRDIREGGGPIVSASGLFVAALWLAILGLEIYRAGLSRSLVSRPDRLFGWQDAPRWLALTLLGLAWAISLTRFALALRSRTKTRRAGATVVILLGLAAVAGVCVQLFPPDRFMYETSQVRGIAALAFVVLVPAGILSAGIGLIASGSSLVGWASIAWGALAAWTAGAGSVFGAMYGADQPQLDAMIEVQALLGLWCAGIGIWLLVGRWAAGRRPTWFHGVGRRWKRMATAMLVVALAGIGASQMLAQVESYAALGPVVAAQVAGRTQGSTVTVGSVARSYRVYRPTSPAPRPGLVIVLHGVFGSGLQAEVMTGFDAQADRLGWIVAYPDGVLDGWDAFGSTASWGRHPGADDVAFVSALIDTLRRTDGVDPDRVYVTGISRGGMMTNRLGCELASKIAAIAPVSGNMATASGSALDVPCAPERPVSVLAIHGTADGTIPIAGGRVDIAFAPLADVMAKWRTVDRCDGTPKVAIEGPSTTTSWTCPDATTVAMRVVQGGGHSWPGSPEGSSGPNATFGAARLIADFFVAHARTS